MFPLPRWNRSAAPAAIRLIESDKLPGELAFLDCRTVEQVWEAIKVLRVRGAPAIGVAAAYGVVLAAHAAIGSRPPVRAARARPATTSPRPVQRQ